MSDAIFVEIPFININDDLVKLTAWLVREGDEVSRGQDIAAVETSTTAAEIAAPASGKIHLKSAAGDRLLSGAVIAYIGAVVPWVASIELAAKNGENDSLLAPHTIINGAANPLFNKKSLEFPERRDLSPELFHKDEFVIDRNVFDHVKHNDAAASDVPELHHALRGVVVGNVTFPAIMANTEYGMVDPAFLKALQKSSKSFGRLKSDRKCRLYREHGAEVGEDVVIGKDTFVVAPRIQIGDRVRLGDNSRIILRERLAIGALSSFGNDLIIHGGTAVFGANTFAGSRVQIRTEGHPGPSSLLISGNNVHLADDIFADISRPILIGKEVFVGRRSLFMTDHLRKSILEGYESSPLPIFLEDFSEVGVNSSVYSGARIGRSAIVGPNSYVASFIPEEKLAIGVPARVVGDVAQRIDRVKQVQIVEKMVREFQELLAFRGVQVSPVNTCPYLHFTAAHQSQTMCLVFMERSAKLPAELRFPGETVVWTLGASPCSPRPKATYIDLLGKTICNPSGILAEASREFLRNHGIRLEPGPWRYERGLV
ncbi:MAG TPA: biotin/lipoyl-containing protein [Candidatus Acidoferrales bacterium]|jgi:acetyltransferase-like isoleucine patch superfamily enzyme|nr:biotin/lipoyl-containing protein [Candidatus Acidoferrales bacterium]